MMFLNLLWDWKGFVNYLWKYLTIFVTLLLEENRMNQLLLFLWVLLFCLLVFLSLFLLPWLSYCYFCYSLLACHLNHNSKQLFLYKYKNRYILSKYQTDGILTIYIFYLWNMMKIFILCTKKPREIYLCHNIL